MDVLASRETNPGLVRGLGFWQAVGLNVSNMIGIGPFVTIPLFLSEMQGPHALVAWVSAAVIVLCDGMVCSELGAALPGSGGAYHVLRNTFGTTRWGRIVPFLFVWQFLVTGSLEMASGYLGAMQYVAYVFPNFDWRPFGPALPGVANVVAAGATLVVAGMLLGPIGRLGNLGLALGAGSVFTVICVIACGLWAFNPALLKVPPEKLASPSAFFAGIGAAMSIAIYDYLGYYNVCHLGDEVREPGRTIPRAVITSIVLVASLYLLMNLSIIGVIAWDEAAASKNIAALFMERLFGRPVAIAFTLLILWTVVACMFAITLGYSRIPYSAALQGDFFRVFGRITEKDRYPVVSLLSLAGLTALFCFLPFDTVVEAAVVCRIPMQFVAQIAALHFLRTRRPEIARPFSMRWYPLPSLVALVGWMFLLYSAKVSLQQVALLITVTGMLLYPVWRKTLAK